jgi:hypothetical protein
MQIVQLNSSPNQRLSVPLYVNGANLVLQFAVRFAEMLGYWIMSIYDQSGNLILGTVPLVTGSYPGANILAPFAYMQIGSAQVINASGVSNPDFPNSSDLGTDFVLLWDDNQ